MNNGRDVLTVSHSAHAQRRSRRVSESEKSGEVGERSAEQGPRISRTESRRWSTHSPIAFRRIDKVICHHKVAVIVGIDVADGSRRDRNKSILGIMREFREWVMGKHKCECGAVYEVLTTRTPFPNTDSATCDVCGITMASWWNSTNLRSYTLIDRPKGAS